MTGGSPGDAIAQGARKNRTGPNGCLRFDRRFARFGIARVQHSSGTRDQEEFAYRNGILTRLAKGRHGETLRAFASGEITIEDLVEFDRDGNLRFGLRDLRSAPAQFTRGAVPLTSPVRQSPRSPSAEQAVERQPELGLPLRTAAFDVAIPSMCHIEPSSRRRYSTSVRALLQTFGAFALPESASALLAKLSPQRWAALRAARMGGLTVGTLRELTAQDVHHRRARLRTIGRRVSEDVFERLAGLTHAEWAALSRAAEYPIDEELVLMLEREGPQRRAVLRRLGATLGSAAIVADLDRLTEREWQTIAKHWCASPSDWNHMRRSLSAVLSALLGTHRHPFRHRVIDRIPLRKEVERVPNISREKLADVVTHLPAAVRLFPWFLVLSGLRIGEYLRLRRRHLRPHTFVIEVAGTKTEGSRRSILVEESAWWVVEEAVPCLLSYGRLRQHWVAACARSGVDGVTLHDLRHCSGQWAVEGGADEGAVQDHLGHATRAMTQRYTRRANQGRAARALSGLVMPLVHR